MVTKVAREVWGPRGMRRTATIPGRNIAYSIRQAIFVARHGSRVDRALAGSAGMSAVDSTGTLGRFAERPGAYTRASPPAGLYPGRPPPPDPGLGVASP